MSIRIVFFSLLETCWAQIPNSDVGDYPSGVLTLMTACWLFFNNSTSTLYGMLPQYWLTPGMQTAKRQYRDELGRVKCCRRNCYHGDPADTIALAEVLRKDFQKKGIDLSEISEQIVASGSWSFAILARASDDEVRRGSLLLSNVIPKAQEQQWIYDFRTWEADVNAMASLWMKLSEPLSTPVLAFSKRVHMFTADAITVRVGSRRKTMNLGVQNLLAHSVAAAAARDAQRCVVFQAMLIAIWAGAGLRPANLPRLWANPVLVPATSLKLRAVMPPPGSIIAYEPIETHGLWVYLVLITAARITISSATALGSSGSLWFAVFAGLYLTNPSAASSFGREKYDARADSGLMSGEGFYMNFSRGELSTHVRLHDRLESLSVFLLVISVVAIRIFQQRLRAFLGYGHWTESAPWQMIPGILLSTWASGTCIGELITNWPNWDRRKPPLSNIKALLHTALALFTCLGCVSLGVGSLITAYCGSQQARSLRWAAYGLAEFQSWQILMWFFWHHDKVDRPDMWFANTLPLSATWGGTLLAVAADPGVSL